MEKIDLDHLTIVLHRPRYPENIGAAARAMRNMGVRRLSVVEPRDCDLNKILKLATHGAMDVIENMAVHDNLSEALSSFNYVVGTTARLGGQRRVVITPSKLGEHLISFSGNNRIAIVFGPEDRGLTNEEIRYCHLMVTIPTAEFSSLNLSQAVMVICYELLQADRKQGGGYAPRLASRHELDGMYEQLKSVLIKISFINPENPDYWMNNLRQFFNRHQLRAKEVRIVRGICRQIDWYGEKCFTDGLKKKD
ncbi:RNA methyltransferase [Thermodesulfobacteriota bacterium]